MKWFLTKEFTVSLVGPSPVGARDPASHEFVGTKHKSGEVAGLVETPRLSCLAACSQLQYITCTSEIKTRKLCYRKDVGAMRLGIFDRFSQSDNTHMVRC